MAEAVDVARASGLHLDDAQQLVVEHAPGEGTDGRWSSKTVGLLEPRQNGKTTLLMARCLPGLFVLRERIIWTSHQFRTSTSSLEAMEAVIDATPGARMGATTPVAPAVGDIYSISGTYGRLGLSRYEARTASNLFSKC